MEKAAKVMKWWLFLLRRNWGWLEGIERFDLLAISQGCAVSIAYAARHPERVSHLVLYGAYAQGRLQRTDTPDEVEKGRVLLDLTRLGWGQENHAFLQVWASRFQPGGTLEHLRSWSDQQRAATSAETAVRLFEIGWNTDVREAARELLASEGLANDVSVEAITDPSRGLFLRIKAAPDKAVAAQRLLQKFPVKIEIEP